MHMVCYAVQQQVVIVFVYNTWANKQFLHILKTKVVGGSRIFAIRLFKSARGSFDLPRGADTYFDGDVPYDTWIQNIGCEHCVDFCFSSRIQRTDSNASWWHLIVTACHDDISEWQALMTICHIMAVCFSTLSEQSACVITNYRSTTTSLRIQH